jgi:hypothetical protein
MIHPLIRRCVFALSLVFAASLTLWWPGDAPFINDEPRLFLLAHEANQHHHLAQCGLIGTVGLSYGPLPVWFYQIVSAVTSSPAGWVIIRSAFMLCMIISGLFLLSRALNLWTWFIPVVLVSPYIWFYSRHLWDNSFLLPLSALAVGAYACFLKKKSPVFLFLTIVMTLSMPLVHLMALPLSITLAVHMVLCARKELWHLRIPLLGFLVVITIMHGPYISAFITFISSYHPHSAHQSTDQWLGWLFPFSGGRFLSACGLEYFFGTNWFGHHALFTVLRNCTGVMYVIPLIGIYIAGKEVYREMLLLSGTMRLTGARHTTSARTHVALIALIVFILQIIMCGATRSWFHPHYYNGQWIITVFFAWIVVDRIAKGLYGKVLAAAYGIVCASLLIIIMNLVHVRGGSRGISYGPTISNQLAIAQAIGSENRTDIYCNVPNFNSFPSIEALRILCIRDRTRQEKGPLLIDYATTDSLYGLVCVRKVSP